MPDKNYNDGKLGGVCRRKGWALEQIYTVWGKYSLYRYGNVASVPYTPSRYVNVGDELEMFNVVNYPCMPYLGEGFAYKSGSIPKTDILIRPNLGYDYLRVFKDGAEIAFSPFAITDETEKVSVGFSEVGSYEAYLCTMDGDSDIYVTPKCHWSVIE